jgi:hypothetical protein
MKDNDDVHGSRSEYDRYESKYGFTDSKLLITDLPPHLLASPLFVMCDRCKEWTSESEPCCG